MDEAPLRLLVIVKRGPEVWQQAWDEPQKIITRVLKRLKYNSLISPNNVYDSPECRFMAVSRWDSVVFLVCDLFNFDYNHETAHLEGNNELPVKVVRVRQHRSRDGIVIKARAPPQAIARVGEALRDFHRSNGWDVYPPFKVDHANGVWPVYTHSRSVCPKPQKSDESTT
ncbi:hypothetical protein AAL_07340 [Moelleriella libera RCEF 2490]|uniref:Uncharacterized protein n=1 Tax=Moelleriella libera RCEF 2490 TaxID=1081109 RepID=A0A167XLQ4_9HYPO|nr:hypothetical protein AAL_07340 [Moelleriella libera RCEF 2490]